MISRVRGGRGGGTGEWRRYWCLTAPLVASVYVTLALGVLLLARALGLGSGVGALGGLVFWLAYSLWGARPGAEERAGQPDWRTAGRRHTGGVVALERPRRSTSARGAGGGAAADSDAADQPEATSRPVAERTRTRPTTTGDVAWAGGVLAVDVTVVVVLLTTRAWSAWVTALAVVLLVTHLWTAARLLRRRRAEGRSLQR